MRVGIGRRVNKDRILRACLGAAAGRRQSPGDIQNLVDTTADPADEHMPARRPGLVEERTPEPMGCGQRERRYKLIMVVVGHN